MSRILDRELGAVAASVRPRLPALFEPGLLQLHVESSTAPADAGSPRQEAEATTPGPPDRRRDGARRSRSARTEPGPPEPEQGSSTPARSERPKGREPRPLVPSATDRDLRQPLAPPLAQARPSGSATSAAPAPGPTRPRRRSSDMPATTPAPTKDRTVDDLPLSRPRGTASPGPIHGRPRPATPAEAPPAPIAPVASAPVVRITIGRVEVRSGPGQPAPRVPTRPAQRRTPALSLADYLGQRHGGSEGRP